MFNMSSVVLYNCPRRCRHSVIDWLMTFCDNLPHFSVKARLSSSTDSNFQVWGPSWYRQFIALRAFRHITQIKSNMAADRHLETNGYDVI